MAKKSFQHLELSLEQKRQLITMLSESYPIAPTCDLLGCSRSSYYYRLSRREEDELDAVIESVTLVWPTRRMDALQAGFSILSSDR